MKCSRCSIRHGSIHCIQSSGLFFPRLPISIKVQFASLDFYTSPASFLSFHSFPLPLPSLLLCPLCPAWTFGVPAGVPADVPAGVRAKLPAGFTTLSRCLSWPLPGRCPGVPVGVPDGAPDGAHDCVFPGLDWGPRGLADTLLASILVSLG
jgi:hypothetical protein